MVGVELFETVQPADELQTRKLAVAIAIHSAETNGPGSGVSLSPLLLVVTTTLDMD